MSALLRTGGVVHNRLTALLSLSIVVVLFVGVSALPAQTLSIDVLDQSFGLGRFEVPLQASGGTEPYTWQLDNATCLPAGVSLRTDVPSWWGPPQPQAVLWGVTSAATAPRAYTCGLKVTDS